MPETIFSKIIARTIPARIEYEDDRCLAFHDVAPQAPLHVLVIPRKALAGLGDAGADDAALLGHLLLVGRAVAERLGYPSARYVVNHGAPSGQSVFHLHVHVLAGRPLAWPPG